MIVIVLSFIIIFINVHAIQKILSTMCTNILFLMQTYVFNMLVFLFDFT